MSGINQGNSIGCETEAASSVRDGATMGHKFRNNYHVECFAPDGSLKWSEDIYNLVANVGLDDVLDKYFKGSTYTAAFYVGLTQGSPSFAAANTMSSHAGWTEDENYSEGVRQTLTLGTVSGQSVSNSASKATFSINGSATVGGAFVTTSSTKGGTTGTLYGGAAFSGGNRTVANGDTVTVTITLTAASA